MKAIIEGVLLFVIVAWAMWALSSDDQCVRVDRWAAPVRGIGNMARAVSEPWEKSEPEKAKLVRWSATADEEAKRLIAQQFYGGALRCNRPPADPLLPGVKSSEIVVGMESYRREMAAGNTLRWIDKKGSIVTDEFLLHRLEASFAAQVGVAPAGTKALQ